MKTLQEIFHHDDRQSELIIPAAPTARGLQLLSPEEIKGVAGGPEGEVGSGVSPPKKGS